MKLFNLFHTAHIYITVAANKFFDLAHPELSPTTPLAILEYAFANVFFWVFNHIESTIHAARLKIFPKYRLAHKYHMAVISIYRYIKLTQLNAREEIILNERRKVHERLLAYLVADSYHQWPEDRQAKLYPYRIPRSLEKLGIDNKSDAPAIYLDLLEKLTLGTD